MSDKPNLNAALAAERTWEARADLSAAEAWVHKEVATIWGDARRAVSDAHGVEKMLAKNEPLEERMVRARLMLAHVGEWLKAVEQHHKELIGPTPPFTIKPADIAMVLESEHGTVVKETATRALAMARGAAAWAEHLIEHAQQEVTS